MADIDPGAGHEPDVVSTKAVVRFLVGLAVAFGVISAAMWGLFHLLARDAKSLDRPVPPGVARALARLPPYPRLEDKPLAPRATLNAEEKARLASYGWVDRGSGTVHIPIERAMDLVAERGIRPTAPGPAPAPPPAAAAGAAPVVKPLPGAAR